MATLAVKNKITLKNILLATDFSASAARAVPFALGLADRYGSKLYVAHVIPREAYAFALPESVEPILKEARDYAEYLLDQLLAPMRSRGRPCQALVGNGEIPTALTEFVQIYDADLVVVGTSSRKGLGKIFLGSIAEEIIRSAPRPVLAVGQHVSEKAPTEIQSILYATDFSPESLRAADYAVSLAQEYDAHLTLLHVLERGFSESPQITLQVAKQRLSELVSAELGLPCRAQIAVEKGPVAETILKLAAEFSADMMVMGVRGAGALAERASHFGSIAHKVVSRATCPVLTVGHVTKGESRAASN